MLVSEKIIFIVILTFFVLFFMFIIYSIFWCSCKNSCSCKDTEQIINSAALPVTPAKAMGSSSGNSISLNPIILVNGLGGCSLYSRWNFTPQQVSQLGYICSAQQKEWYHDWASMEATLPNSAGGGCWRYRMTMQYDGSSVNTPFKCVDNCERTAWRDNLPVIDTKDGVNFTKDFGGLMGVDTLTKIEGFDVSAAHMYHNLISFLDDTLGYREMQSLFGAHYNFSEILNKSYQDTYFNMLRVLIEYAVEKNGGRRAHVIGHSLGCPTLMTFFSRMSQAWKDQYVQTMISVAGPFAGSPKATKAAFAGDNEGLGILCDNPLVKKQDCNYWYQQVEKLFAGVVWMFPDQDVFSALNIVEMGSGPSRLIYTVGATGSLGTTKLSLKQLFSDADIASSYDAYQQTAVPLIPVLVRPPGVKFYAVYPLLEDQVKTGGTPISYRFKTTGLSGFKTIPSEGTELEYHTALFGPGGTANEIQNRIRGNTPIDQMFGDGTVPWLSLHVPDLWKAGQVYESKHPVTGCTIPVITREFRGKGCEHKGICDKPLFWRYIMDIIESNTDTMPHYWTVPGCPVQPIVNNCPECDMNPQSECTFLKTKADQKGAKQDRCQVLCDRDGIPGDWSYWKDSCPTPGDAPDKNYCHNTIGFPSHCFSGSVFSQ